MRNLFQFRGEAAVEHEDVDYKVGKTLSRRHNSAIVVYYDHRAHRSEAESLLVKARSKTFFLLYGDEFQRALRAKGCLCALAELSRSPAELTVSTEIYTHAI